MIPLFAILAAGAGGPATGSGVGLTTAQLVLAVLGTAGVASVLGALVTGAFNRKKLGADATEIITKAATGVVERIEAENTRLNSELGNERNARHRLERELEAERAAREKLSREMDRFRRLAIQHTHILQMHAAWDALAVSALEKAGVDGMPKPPPPLYGPELTPSMVREGTLEDDQIV